MERTAHNVLRINQNGIGFSSTGVAGPYTQAWTLDGKLVIGGTNVPSLTVYDNSQNIIFQTSSSGTIWNSANSSMSASGVLSAVGAILTNAEIISTNTTGAGVDVNATNGQVIFKWQGVDIATIVATHENNKTYLDISSDDYLSLNADVDIGITAYRDVNIESENRDVNITADDDVTVRGNYISLDASTVSINGNGLDFLAESDGALHDVEAQIITSTGLSDISVVYNSDYGGYFVIADSWWGMYTGFDFEVPNRSEIYFYTKDRIPVLSFN